MLKTIFISFFVFLFALSACEQANPVATSPTPSSGVEGIITEGPMCPGPVPVGNNPCPDQPYQASISILDANNNQITQIQAGVDGYFKITLAPGTYVLHPESGKPYPHASDQSVVVIDGQFTQVTILYDTGMR